MKVKFQHEVYPPCKPECESSLLEYPVSRQVFIVQDLEIRDRLATSQMNKFLYLYCSKDMPRKAHSNMVRCLEALLFSLVLEKHFYLCLTAVELIRVGRITGNGKVFSLFNMKIPVKYTVLSFVFKNYFTDYMS